MELLRALTLRATFVLLTASVALILPSLAGIGASGPAFAVLLAAAAVLAAVRPHIAALPPVVGYDIGNPLKDIWLGPVVGVAMVLIIAPGASAGELQAIGGIAGFLGMVNYFVRPLYLYLYHLLHRFVARDSSA